MELTFHFFFHNAAALPEKLTEGREAIYLQHFFDRLVGRSTILGVGKSVRLVDGPEFRPVDMESLLSHGH